MREGDGAARLVGGLGSACLHASVSVSVRVRVCACVTVRLWERERERESDALTTRGWANRVPWTARRPLRSVLKAEPPEASPMLRLSSSPVFFQHTLFFFFYPILFCTDRQIDRRVCVCVCVCMYVCLHCSNPEEISAHQNLHVSQNVRQAPRKHARIPSPPGLCHAIWMFDPLLVQTCSPTAAACRPIDQQPHAFPCSPPRNGFPRPLGATDAVWIGT